MWRNIYPAALVPISGRFAELMPPLVNKLPLSFAAVSSLHVLVGQRRSHQRLVGHLGLTVLAASQALDLDVLQLKPNLHDKKFLLRIYEAPIFSQEPEVPSLAAVILAVQFSSSPALWRYFVSAADITTTCNAIWKKELIKIQDAHQLRHDLSPRCRGQQVWPHSGASPGRSRSHNN